MNLWTDMKRKLKKKTYLSFSQEIKIEQLLVKKMRKTPLSLAKLYCYTIYRSNKCVFAHKYVRLNVVTGNLLQKEVQCKNAVSEFPALQLTQNRLLYRNSLPVISSIQFCFLAFTRDCFHSIDPHYFLKQNTLFMQSWSKYKVSEFRVIQPR